MSKFNRTILFSLWRHLMNQSFHSALKCTHVARWPKTSFQTDNEAPYKTCWIFRLKVKLLVLYIDILSSKKYLLAGLENNFLGEIHWLHLNTKVQCTFIKKKENKTQHLRLIHFLPLILCKKNGHFKVVISAMIIYVQEIQKVIISFSRLSAWFL